MEGQRTDQERAGPEGQAEARQAHGSAQGDRTGLSKPGFLRRQLCPVWGPCPGLKGALPAPTGFWAVLAPPGFPGLSSAAVG